MRGRPPKPIAEHELTGTLRADRHGTAAAQFRPEGLPEKPATLKGDAGDLWDFMLSELNRKNVATRIDTVALVAACEWYALYRRSMKVLQKTKPDACNVRPLTLATQAYWKNFEEVALQFGMTPVARMRLRLPNAEKKQGVVTRMTRTA